MITVRIWEGLGNQMFQYAYARNMKEQTGKNVFLEGRRIYRNSLPDEDLNVERQCGLHHYNITLKFIKPCYLKKWNYLQNKTLLQKIEYKLAREGLTKYGFLTDQGKQTSYLEELFAPGENCYIMGHFFHRKYVEPIRDILLKEFTLKEPIIMQDRLRSIMNSKETVSLHIRRGDYLFVESVQAISKEMKSNQYYSKAMAYVADRVEHPVFLIFSDDIEWVKQNFACPYTHIYISDMGFKDYQELMLMSQCKHNIIANSTFSFWGGWLNQNEEKIVTVPKHWMPSVVPKDWIRI